MSLALFDILEGRFGGVTPVESVPSEEHLVQSIVGNLQRLLNTRQGSVPHLPLYGLPDLVSAQKDTAASTETLRLQVRAAVMAYEPRLSRVRVEAGEADAHDMRVSFIISGVVPTGEWVQLETIFGSQERTDVRPL